MLPWIISAFTICSVILSGRKKSYAWLVGLLCQSLWIIFAIQTRAWGLLPMNVVLVVLFTRNYLRWLADDKKLSPEIELARKVKKLKRSRYSKIGGDTIEFVPLKAVLKLIEK